ncbi:phage portal protein [Gemmatimonas sp.]|uniref:phage portal protein n=1 Tax=Gemmatimonas sp. TaxID=1962908 RepID=UPI0037C19A51
MKRHTRAALPRLQQAKKPKARAFFGRGGYEGARTDVRELMAWLPGLGSPDQDILGDLPALRARTRDLERNAPLATGALLTRLDNVVGGGLLPTPQIDRDYLGLTEQEASAWQRDAMRIVKAVAYSKRFDVAGRNSFPQMQRLALRSVLSGGDAFALRRYVPRAGDVLALKIQLLEADRVGNPTGHMNTPTLRDGIVLDQYGAATGFYIASHHPSEAGFGQGFPKYDFVPAYGSRSGLPMVLHIIEQQRVNQTRGVPYLAPVIRQLKQLDRFTDSELAAAVIASFFTVFIKRTGSVEDGKSLADLEDADTLPIGAGDNVKLGQGAVVELPAGDDISIANPGRPNAQFDPFVSSISTFMGVALGIPRELLLKQFNSSYSASRAALQEAWRAFDAQQDWLVETFCQPIYEWIIWEAVQRGLLVAPGFLEDPMTRMAYLGAMWAGPTVTQLDPLKEVNAAILRVDAGFSTRALEAPQLTGQSWEAVHEQLVREKNRRVADGLAPTEIITAGRGATVPTDDNETPPEGTTEETDAKE